MKKSIILFVTLTFFLLVSCETKKRPSGNPSEVLEKATYNKLQKSYESIMNFEEGTAIVKKGLYGLIDENGREVLICEYDSISEFEKGCRIIVKSSKYGAVNIDGKIIKPCSYSDALIICDSYIALKMNDKWGIVDHEGKEMTQFKYEEISPYFSTDSAFVAKYDGFWGVSDYQENTLIPYKYDDIWYKLSSTATTVQLNDKWGLYNSKNKEVLPCEYARMYPDSSGYVTVEKKGNSYKTSRKALIETETGKIVIPFEYMDMGNYSEGLLAVEDLNGKWGFIDIKRNTIIPFIYDNAGDFSEGLAAVHKKTGEFMRTVIWDRAPVENCGYIDRTGKVIIPFKFRANITTYGHQFSNGLAVQGISKNNLWANKFGYINKTGQWIVEPIYDSAEPFEKGLGKVEKDEKVGCVNTKGELVIPCIYDEFSGDFINDSVIQFMKDHEPCYFNREGKPVIIK